MGIVKNSVVLLLGASALLVAASGVWAAELVFDTPVHYSVGEAPYCVIATDLDDDGDNDLVVANSHSNTVSILWNSGSGTFQPAIHYPTGGAPRSVFAADFDGDDNKDLVTANFDDRAITVLINNGDSTFQAPVEYDAVHGPHSVISTDFDGDNDNDLAVACYLADFVCVFLNNGDGTFADMVTYRVGNAPRSIISVDLDGDGVTDLAISQFDYDYGAAGLLSNGDGSFQTPIEYFTSMASTSVCGNDFNQDGFNDLAITVDPMNADLLLSYGDSTGMLDWPLFNPIRTGFSPMSVFSIDLNGDNLNDLITANMGIYPTYTGSVSILLGDDMHWPFQDDSAYAVGDATISVFSADLDGDGDNDVVAANRDSDNVAILFNLSGPFACCGIYTGGIAGNANCSDDGKLTLSDITRLIDRVYISKDPLCCKASGNTNGSTDCKLTLSDITVLIDAVYISKVDPAECMPECET